MMPPSTLSGATPPDRIWDGSSPTYPTAPRPTAAQLLIAARPMPQPLWNPAYYTVPTCDHDVSPTAMVTGAQESPSATTASPMPLTPPTPRSASTPTPLSL